MPEELRKPPRHWSRTILKYGMMLCFLAVAVFLAGTYRTEQGRWVALFFLIAAIACTQIRDRQRYADVYGWELQAVQMDALKRTRTFLAVYAVYFSLVILISCAAGISILVSGFTDSLAAMAIGVLLAIFFVVLPCRGFFSNLKLAKRIKEGNLTLHHGTLIQKERDEDSDGGVSFTLQFSDGEKTWYISTTRGKFREAGDDLTTQAAFSCGEDIGIYYIEDRGTFTRY